MGGSYCCKLNWKLNPYYDKYELFDDKFNWCPF